MFFQRISLIYAKNGPRGYRWKNNNLVYGNHCVRGVHVKFNWFDGSDFTWFHKPCESSHGSVISHGLHVLVMN
jgi:hypothetical protein